MPKGVFPPHKYGAFKYIKAVLIKALLGLMPLVLVPSKSKLEVLISLLFKKDNEAPSGIGSNRLFGAVI